MITRDLDLTGIFTALVTPFTKDASAVDYSSLEALVESQIKGGAAGVVVCGSTGEAATLSDDEYTSVVRFVRERTRGRIPCISGISVSATAKAIELAKVGRELGCDGLLIATPPYNKPSQGGIIEHFRAIHKAVEGLPLIAYNIPGRSGVAISASTLGVLSNEGLIIGIKESSGSVDALADTMKCISSSCQVVTGDDSLTLAVLAYGGVGAISASGNVLVSEMSRLVAAWRNGDCAVAKGIQLEILTRIRALFVESNPVPVKCVLALQGVISYPSVRLPLVSVSEVALERLKEEFNLV
jgi:4-hydroxy-tetrahydrodipicolinate synthase